MTRQRPLLTELAVARARPRKARYTMRDGPGGIPGLVCTVQPSGAKSYSIRVRIGAEQPRLACGRHPQVGLAEARARARALLQTIERGEDPRRRVRQGAQERPRDSFAAVVESYTQKRLKPRLKRWTDVEATLHRDAVRAWGDRPIQSLTKRDVRDLLDEVAARGAPVMANRLRAHLSALFRWAIRADYTTVNPVEGVDLPYHEIARDRLIVEDELRLIWAAWLKMSYPFGILGRLLLLSGARRSEWSGAAWSEVDLRDATWSLPGRRSKTGREHMLPLSPQMRAVLAEIPRFAGTDLLFPAARASSTNSISGFSKALIVTHRLSGTSGWHWHDLRRCCRTGFARLGVSAAVGERILNHADGTASRVAEIYNRHSYLPEMRVALAMWGSEVERITRGGEAVVVALRRP